MNRLLLVLLTFVGLSQAGCISASASAEPERCVEFLNSVPLSDDTQSTSFDLERSLDISSPEQLASAYSSLRPLNSGCDIGEINLSDPLDVMDPWGAPHYVDFVAGSIGGARWVQFIYPSVGSGGPGLASSLVFYNSEGEPTFTLLVSEYYSWEKTSLLRSEILGMGVKSCRQEIEYFSYKASGDIEFELESPSRSEFECSITSLPPLG